MNNNTPVKFDADATIERMTQALSGKVDQATIDRNVKAIRQVSDMPRYGSTWGIVSAIFYVHLWVNFSDNNKSGHFEGNGGGAFTPGGGGGGGWVATPDVDELLSSTVSFSIAATPGLTHVDFYDSGSKWLGQNSGFGPSTALGTGGGRGSW